MLPPRTFLACAPHPSLAAPTVQEAAGSVVSPHRGHRSPHLKELSSFHRPCPLLDQCLDPLQALSPAVSSPGAEEHRKHERCSPTLATLCLQSSVPRQAISPSHSSGNPFHQVQTDSSHPKDLDPCWQAPLPGGVPCSLSCLRFPGDKDYLEKGSKHGKPDVPAGSRGQGGGGGGEPLMALTGTQLAQRSCMYDLEVS